MTFTCWRVSSTSPSPDAVGPATPRVGPAWPGLSVCTSSDRRRNHADGLGRLSRPPLKPLPCPQTAGVWEGGVPQGHRSRSHSFRSNNKGSPSPLPPRLGADTCAWRGPERGEGSWGSVPAAPPFPGASGRDHRRLLGSGTGLGFSWGARCRLRGSLGRGSIRVLLCMLFCKYLLGTLIYSKNIFHNVSESCDGSLWRGHARVGLCPAAACSEWSRPRSPSSVPQARTVARRHQTDFLTLPPAAFWECRGVAP